MLALFLFKNSNLKSLVEQGKVCCGGVGQGITAQNGYSSTYALAMFYYGTSMYLISSSYNEAIRHHSGAIYPVALLLVE